MANYNPLWPFFLLLMGLVAAVLTTLWAVHVVVFMFFYPPQSQFLNKYFIQVRNTQSRPSNQLPQPTT